MILCVVCVDCVLIDVIVDADLIAFIVGRLPPSAANGGVRDLNTFLAKVVNRFSKPVGPFVFFEFDRYSFSYK